MQESNTNTTLHAEILRNATPVQLEQAAAFNHSELFCHNALSVGGEVHRSEGVTWTNAGDSIESMVAFPQLSETHAGEQLDEIIQYYLNHPPRGAGCWSLEPSQPKDLGIRLLARGFQPGWQPRWMALDLEQLRLDHPVPDRLMVVPDNTSHIHTIKNLPYGNEDIRIFSNQQTETHGYLQRFIAKLDGKIVAHCGVLLTRGALGAGGIYHVGVLSRFRNRGIGKAVVGAACQYAKNKGYQYVLLNGTGHRMYEQLGFKILGYGNTWWLVTSRLLAHPPTKNEIALAEAIGRGDLISLENVGRNVSVEVLKAPLTNGMTLMQLAVHCRQPDSAKWLIARGVSIYPIEAWDLGWKDRAAAILTEYPEQVNQQYGDSEITMLHISAERDDTELAKLAISAKPDLHIKDKNYNSTALDWARHLKKDLISRLIETYMETLR